MTVTFRFTFAAAFALSFAGAALANDAERRSLYSSLNLLTFFNKETKAELNVTPDQDRRLKAGEERRQKLWQRYAEASRKVTESKLSEREKNAKERTLETQLVDNLCKMYGETLRPEQVKRMKQIVLQVRGMEIFDHPEILKALKIGDREVKKLRAAYDQQAREMADDLRAQVEAKKITNKEAARQALAMTFSVPDRVRASLSKEQQRVLEDLLGKKYTYK
jgi:hypothetical protein